ncbi:MAG: ABC transporter substrate-binding protein [Candidatus Woesearchaeota archaeon]
MTTARIVGLILLIMIITGCTATGKATQTVKPITTGYIGPMSGYPAVFGIPEQHAIEMALETINENGGINGRPLRVVFEDGKCTAKGATDAANKLIHEEGLKILLVDCSVETLATAEIAEPAKVIVLTAWAMHPDITDAGDFVFRTSISDKDTAKLIAQVMKTKGIQNVGILTELTGYPSGLRDVLLPALEVQGIQAITESFTQGSVDVKRN